MTNPFSFGPISYSDVQPIQLERHANAGVAPDAWLSIVPGVRAVPLLVPEFRRACLDFPVLFTAGEDPFPVGLVGRGGTWDGLAVDGTWPSEIYIPAAFRRYPFVLSAAAADGNRTLCVDVSRLHPDLPSEAPGRFFVDGQPTRYSMERLRFCQAFEAQLEESVVFGQVLRETGLLVPRTIRRRGADGTELPLGAFQAVDPERVAALDDAVLIELQRSGALAAIHAHMLSLGRLGWTNGEG